MKFTLTFSCNGEAFNGANEDPAREVARILEDAARRIRHDGLPDLEPHRLRDSNGNRVGFFALEDES